MAAAIGRGAQNMNSVYFKPMLRKAYHRKSNSPDMMGDTVKLNGEEVKNKSLNSSHETQSWIPDHRTGIYYPKGQEKVIEDVPPQAAKDFSINWFSKQ